MPFKGSATRRRQRRRGFIFWNVFENMQILDVVRPGLRRIVFVLCGVSRRLRFLIKTTPP